MKVAFVNFDDGNGGAAKAATRLAEALIRHHKLEIDFYVGLKQNKESKVIQLGGLGRYSFYRNYLNFILERIYFLFFEKSKAVRFGFSPAYVGLDLEKYIDFGKYDIIHLHWTNFGLLSNRTIDSLIKSGKKIVWTLHDMWSFTGGCHYSLDCIQYRNKCERCENYLAHPEKSNLTRRLQQKKQSIFFDSQNLTLVACSKWLQNEARNSWVLKEKQVLQISNCISSKAFHPIDKNTAKRELSIDENTNYILFISEKVADQRKGFSYLLDAVRLLENKVENAALLIIGGKAEEFDLPIHGIYLGHIADEEKLNLVYNAASVFVIPSLQDNLPNTILEAYSAGTPVVGFRNSGIEEMVKHEKTGYLADFKSAPDLAKGIGWVLSQNNLSSSCLNEAKESYAPELIALKYHEVYKEALN